MAVKFYVDEKYRNSRKEIVIHDEEHLTTEARVAISLVEKWGMIYANIEGEDSSGRQKFETASVSEVVKRACDMTESLFDEMRKRNWVPIMPNPFESKEQE
jgi:hypothetical protein